jgi:hypothetical protein
MSLILKAAQKYSTPRSVQNFISNLKYNAEENGETILSAETALRLKTCHCLEAVFIAAAILEHHGYDPLVLSMESKDQLDHVVFLFRYKNRWGSIARSRDRGLHGRAPVFKTIKDLVRSYFAPYVDKTGRIHSYQVFHLDETQTNWRSSPNNLWAIEQYFGLSKHTPIYFSDKNYKKVKERYLREGPLKTGPHWWAPQKQR